jgi:CRISPR-associated protein Csb2
MRIEVEFLTGTVYASDGANGTEWPPHPARLFSAMVNAAKEADMGDTGDEALRWLESQGPPEIRAGEAAETHPVTRFVPPNYPRFRNPCHLLPWLRHGAPQKRTFPAQTPSDPMVSFQWPTIKSYPEILPQIVRRVGHLGHSSSLVRASVENDFVEPTLVPDPHGSAALGVPTPGRLKELEDCYSLGHRPVPPAFHRYRYVAPTVAESSHGDMIVIRQAGGLPIPVEATLTFTMALRGALIAVADEQGLLLPEIHGHQDGPHCAYLPLPFSGWQHANGFIMGAAIALPRGIGAAVRQRIYRVCAGLDHVAVPAFGCWQPGPVGSDAPLTLRPSTWVGPATTWGTLTPVVLKHRPSVKFQRPLEQMIGDYCIAAGLPKPAEVRAGRYPFLPNVPPAYDFRLRRKAAEPEERFAAHALLRFSQPVEGPVVLGKLRHFGLGLLRPVAGFEDGR